MNAPTHRPVALVTGASAGIGEAFADLLARRGHDVVLVARRADRLELLSKRLASLGARAWPMPFDLADPRTPEFLVERIGLECPPIDVLVNNAGYGIASRFAETPWTTHEAFLRVLLTSTLELAHRLLPSMKARRSGRIVNIASLAAFAPDVPGSLYSATKKFMVSWTRSLQQELRGTGVAATAVCPGFTYSEFHDVMGNRSHMNSLPRWMWQDSATVARLGLDAAEAGRTVVVTGGVNKLIAALCWALPNALLESLAPKGLMDRHEHVDAPSRSDVAEPPR
jgi:short-subunit dehydrogenase